VDGLKEMTVGKERVRRKEGVPLNDDLEPPHRHDRSQRGRPRRFACLLPRHHGSLFLPSLGRSVIISPFGGFAHPRRLPVRPLKLEMIVVTGSATVWPPANVNRPSTGVIIDIYRPSIDPFVPPPSSLVVSRCSSIG
jgi:hypothetical protein